MNARTKSPENPVAIAIRQAGGATAAAHACRVSNSAIYQWLELGFVPRSKYAVLLAEASGVSVRELSGLSAEPEPPGPRPKLGSVRELREYPGPRSLRTETGDPTSKQDDQQDRPVDEARAAA